jgi:chemotaxis protein MotB
MPRKKQVAHENHERWLVSYADFITLLFAFFVVMFASSQTDKAKARAVSEAVKDALANGHSVGIPPAVAKVLGGTVDDKGQGNAMMHGPGGAQHADKNTKPEVLELTAPMKMLSRELEQEIKSGKVHVSLEPRGLVVSLSQAAFFPSGGDTIDPARYAAIGKLAVALRSVANPIRIEGHTDSVPIHSPRFRSNWELSAARSISMMELFATKFGVPRDRMAIVGYADTVPLASNATAEGRARNRRVDIVILNNYALRDQPEALNKPPAAKK